MHSVSTRDWFSRGGALGAASGVVLAAVLIHLSPVAGELLQYERAAIANGQIWRIVTCHLTHWSPDHLFWDVAVFACLAAVCLAESRRATWICLAVSAAAIPAAVWVLMPDMPTYRGLSGLDSALFALLTAMLIRRGAAGGNWRPAAVAGGLAAAFVGKTLFELLTGSTMFVDSGTALMVPVPLAHIIGAMVGGAAGMPASPGRANRLTPDDSPYMNNPG
ncbi:MAG: rhombosortase [Thermoguttaceae bacterium]|jgi:rhomboid family GlyGly-CTERM serine protease|nr:rhombosortase [Thermoguttaceae bacterium]